MESLCKFGLTTKQARVYFTIALIGNLKVAEIANLTGIHEQDIYKILPKLEHNGLITKTATKPVVIEALPIEIALKGLIKKQQEKLEDAENSIQEIITFIKNKKVSHTPKDSEPKVKIFNSNSPSYKNDLLGAFSKARKSVDLLGEESDTNQLLRSILFHIKENKNNFEKYKIKMRIIVRYKNFEKDCVSEIYLKKFPDLNIKVKKVPSTPQTTLPFLSYFIIDGKEVWAKISGDPDPNYPFEVMISDCTTIVQIAQENYDRIWQDTHAELLCSTNPDK